MWGMEEGVHGETYPNSLDPVPYPQECPLHRAVVDENGSVCTTEVGVAQAAESLLTSGVPKYFLGYYRV